jgi:hypothetical protein
VRSQTRSTASTGDDQADRNNGEIGRKVHAPGELIGHVFARDQRARFKKFVAFAVRAAILAGLEGIAGMDSDTNGAMTGTDKRGLHLDGARSKSRRLPEVAKGGRLKAIVDLDGRVG